MSRFFTCWSLFLIAASGLLHGQAEPERLALPAIVPESLRQIAMPELDGSKIGKILSRYYTIGLGGEEVFKGVESFKISGTLTAGEQRFRLIALQKKPNFLKLSIRDLKTESSIELAFDGETAWQVLPREGARPMDPPQARRFTHSAAFTSHLLYPYAEGKVIELIDTVPMEGSICHQVRVTLDTGYQVDYFLDIRTLLETKVVSTDLQSGFVTTAIYRDYAREAGWPLARVVDAHENGEKASVLRIDNVQVNTGVMPWMFKMP